MFRWQSFIEKYTPKISYIEEDKNVLADSMSRCKRLVTEQEFVNALYLVPRSEEDNIDKIEGYLNVDSREPDPVLSEHEDSGLQDSDFSTF